LIEPKAIGIFIVGFFFGILVNYIVGRMVVSGLFSKRIGSRITLRTTTYYESIQHVITYLLGFSLGGLLLAPSLFVMLFLGWLTAQAFLAVHIFKFSKLRHGAAFAGVDTASDIIVGVLFGTGTAMTLIRMGLLK